MFFGGLAQLARAPALQAGGHRFDSDILHQREKWELSHFLFLNLKIKKTTKFLLWFNFLST